MKLLKENMGIKFPDLGLGNDILLMLPKAQRTKSNINKWDYIKLKSFCTGKETMKKKEVLLNGRRYL